MSYIVLVYASPAEEELVQAVGTFPSSEAATDWVAEQYDERFYRVQKVDEPTETFKHYECQWCGQPGGH